MLDEKSKGKEVRRAACLNNDIYTQAIESKRHRVVAETVQGGGILSIVEVSRRTLPVLVLTSSQAEGK
jgi:hypothetical protein